MDIQAMHKKPPYGMIAILFIGAFVSFLNNTLINIALPSIMTEFDVKSTTVQWLATGYMLVNGILIPASAFFIQRFSNRRIFITAMTLFTLGTLLACFSPSFAVLLAGRMIQASGSAIMMPLLMNVMLTAFPIEKRGAAMGLFGLVMIAAPAIGPTLSGYLIEHYEWRTLFYVVLPFAVITLLLAIIKLKNITPQRDMKLDFSSLVLSSIAFGSLLYGFSSAGDPEVGWSAPIVIATLSIGTIALITFIWRQLRLDDPMLEFRIYKHPMFALSSAISIVISISMFSGMILTPIYVQTIRGISPMDAGLLMLPGALVMGIMSPITGRLFDKYGAKALAITGLSITIITTYLFSTVTAETSYSYLMFLYTFRMFGFSMVMMPVMTNGMNQLPMKMNPHGTAMNNTLQQVSGAIGTALLVTVMNTRTESRAEELAANAMAKLAEGGAQPSAEAAAEIQNQILNEAMLAGITHAFFISTLIAAIALVLALFIKRVKSPVQTEKESEKVNAKRVAT
ncbi:DHA2 family efflux MFS transporter permease subunit [Bacillus sp. FJAT-50079]|uniref:DHA2 family efflux MFS transporter permease subunit n=1 Tax=Bacillus sp. FJAT-50079 TaxID=2833577 RepID=UPI001BC94264|nr:DHA2 family efflux MFS transporter permease subunit [Bacillus sp. FJAT-50079]MBS4210831.1 DHA2 family efflux MFS transporter permease subunit [Bacillus sp. FJAT-50079]